MFHSGRKIQNIPNWLLYNASLQSRSERARRSECSEAWLAVMYTAWLRCRKHANGSSRVGGLLLRRATESGGPEGRNFRLLRKHS